MDPNPFRLGIFNYALPSTSAPAYVNDPPQHPPPLSPAVLCLHERVGCYTLPTTPYLVHVNNPPQPPPPLHPPAATTYASTPWVYPQKRVGCPDSEPTPSVEAERPLKRRRGRPRKYDTPQPLQPTRKVGRPRKYDKPQPVVQRPGNVEHDFTPHVVEVIAGEDVNLKMLLFSQQSQRRVCILSAYGTVMIASVRQSGIPGGSKGYEGQFQIISLAVIYDYDEYGEPRPRLGGCLSDTDGRVVCGEFDGPLIAARPFEMVLATFSPSPLDRSMIEASVSDPIWRNDDEHLSTGGNPSIPQVSDASILNGDHAPDATISVGVECEL